MLECREALLGDEGRTLRFDFIAKRQTMMRSTFGMWTPIVALYVLSTLTRNKYCGDGAQYEILKNVASTYFELTCQSGATPRPVEGAVDQLET